MIFGDAAGAILLRAGGIDEPGALGPMILGSDGAVVVVGLALVVLPATIGPAGAQAAPAAQSASTPMTAAVYTGIVGSAKPDASGNVTVSLSTGQRIELPAKYLSLVKSADRGSERRSVTLLQDAVPRLLSSSDYRVTRM